MMMPEGIRKIIAEREYSLDTIGMSDSQVLCFDDMVLKIESRSRQTDNEAEMMRWLDGRIPVPKLLAHEHLGENSFLLMSRIEGEMLCDAGLIAEPEKVVRLAAEGLEMLWSVDATEIPDAAITLDKKLQIAEENISAGLCDTENVEPDTYAPNGFASPEKLLQWLIDNRPEEQPALSHGDYCLPNIFAKGGKVNGFIDLGRCGISDKYQDIALCWRSLRDNYNGRHGMYIDRFNPDILFDVLGISPDRELLRYYLLLDELF